MKKKQLITSIACFALLVLMFVGSTIAWFTDTEASVNTMVAGKIAIDQTEVFDNTTVLMPSMEVTKTVTVTNTGNQPCYVRTLFAFEDNADGSVLEMITSNCADGVTIIIPGVTAGYEQLDKVQFAVMKDGKQTLFTVGYYVYPGQLSHSGENASFTSLQSIKLKDEAGNDWMEAIGDQYELFVLSQAVQTTGFNNSAEAFTEAFGDVTGENAAKWFAYVLGKDTRYTSDNEQAVVQPGETVITIGPATP